MITKRIISLMLLLSTLFCSLSFFGCHKRIVMSNFDVPHSFDTTKQYEITFWAKNENNETQRNVYANAVKEFEKIYPNIKVTLKNFVDYKDIYNDVITNISTNTTPNVCITYPDHIATYIEGENVVVPLDSLMQDKKYGLGGSELKFSSPEINEIIPQFLSEGQIGGVQYALPYMRSTEACYVNKDMVEALGFTLPDVLTWEFVWKVSEYAMALGKDENGNFIANGQKTLIPFIYKSTDNMMISMLKQIEAPYSTDAGEIGLFNDTTKDILLEISKHAKTKAFSTFKISSYPANFLNAGQCIFAIDSTAGATWMGCDAPLIDIPLDQLKNFETVVMPIPQFDENNPKMISQGPSLCIFNKEDSGEVLASWIFAQFLLTNEVQIAYSQTEGYVPVTKKAQNSAEYQDYLNRAGENNDLYYDVKINAAKMLIENTENSFTTPVFNGSTSLRSAAGELIEETVKWTRRNKVIDSTFIDGLYSDINSLYKLDQIETGPTKKELGELPNESKILIGSLCAVWIGIILYAVANCLKKNNVKLNKKPRIKTNKKSKPKNENKLEYTYHGFVTDNPSDNNVICKYCKNESHGKPYCSACSKKHFNFDPFYSYPSNSQTPAKLSLIRDGFPNIHETASERADKLFDKLFDR